MELLKVNRGKRVDLFIGPEHTVNTFDYSVNYSVDGLDVVECERSGRVHNCRDMFDVLTAVRQSLPADARITLFHAALSD